MPQTEMKVHKLTNFVSQKYKINMKVQSLFRITSTIRPTVRKINSECTQMSATAWFPITPNISTLTVGTQFFKKIIIQSSVCPMHRIERWVTFSALNSNSEEFQIAEKSLSLKKSILFLTFQSIFVALIHWTLTIFKCMGNNLLENRKEVPLFRKEV